LLSGLNAQAQVLSRHLAAAAHDDLVANAGTFCQVGVARFLNSRNVDEYVLASVVRLNEAIALPGVEPLTVPLATEVFLRSIKLRGANHTPKQKRGADAPRVSPKVGGKLR